MVKISKIATLYIMHHFTAGIYLSTVRFMYTQILTVFSHTDPVLTNACCTVKH